jgi:hypothetical protein
MRQRGADIITIDYRPDEGSVAAPGGGEGAAAGGGEVAGYQPTVTTWGVYPRPKNISEAFGGGRNLAPGQELESKEVAEARAKEYAEMLSKWVCQGGGGGGGVCGGWGAGGLGWRWGWGAGASQGRGAGCRGRGMGRACCVLRVAAAIAAASVLQDGGLLGLLSQACSASTALRLRPCRDTAPNCFASPPRAASAALPGGIGVIAAVLGPPLCHHLLTPPPPLDPPPQVQALHRLAGRPGGPGGGAEAVCPGRAAL